MTETARLIEEIGYCQRLEHMIAILAAKGDPNESLEWWQSRLRKALRRLSRLLGREIVMSAALDKQSQKDRRPIQ